MFTLTYNGKSFNQREDGYINLGELCATHGKQFYDWNRLKGSQEYLMALAETLAQSDTGICVTDGLVISDFDNSGGKSGTWGHPLVAIEVARWINPAFGVWCNMHIKTLIETGKTEVTTRPTSTLELAQIMLDTLKEQERRVTALEQQNIALLQKQEEQQHVLEAVDLEVAANSFEIERFKTGHTYYFTVLAWCNKYKIKKPLAWMTTQGRKATAICKQRNIEPVPVNDPRFGAVNSYPDFILEELTW